jgi:hypothetical protein
MIYLLLKVMDQADYRARLTELEAERSRLYDRRTTLETDLGEIKAQIAHLQEIITHLEPLAGQKDWLDDYSKLGFTDAIREVLKDKATRVSAQGIREALEGGGFSLQGYTSPMQSIYKILSRLVKDEQVNRIADEDGRSISYEWKTSDNSFITDDDIPF